MRKLYSIMAYSISVTTSSNDFVVLASIKETCGFERCLVVHEIHEGCDVYFGTCILQLVSGKSRDTTLVILPIKDSLFNILISVLRLAFRSQRIDAARLFPRLLARCTPRSN